MKTLTIDRSKVRVTNCEGTSNYRVTDTNRGRRCSASIQARGRGFWNVRIDKGGVDGWKYAANIPTATPEAAYEYCLEFGTKVEG